MIFKTLTYNLLRLFLIVWTIAILCTGFHNTFYWEYNEFKNGPLVFIIWLIITLMLHQYYGSYTGSVVEKCKYKICTLIYHVNPKYCILPHAFCLSKLFTKNCCSSCPSLRDKFFPLEVPKTTISFGYWVFQKSSTVLWNAIPHSLKQEETLCSFDRKLKSLLY